MDTHELQALLRWKYRNNARFRWRNDHPKVPPDVGFGVVLPQPNHQVIISPLIGHAFVQLIKAGTLAAVKPKKIPVTKELFPAQWS